MLASVYRPSQPAHFNSNVDVYSHSQNFRALTFAGVGPSVVISQQEQDEEDVEVQRTPEVSEFVSLNAEDIVEEMQE